MKNCFLMPTKKQEFITPEGALPSQVFLAVCKAFSSLWKEKIVFEELKGFSIFSFRIIILPFRFYLKEKFNKKSRRR
jgi:hypothetical protein